MHKKISLSTYREKTLGCWLGKAVGGTLGGPAEGKEGPLSLTFYDPVPNRMLPNDDLDLQVVWLEMIRQHGLPVERRLLASGWMEHVRLWPDEYGVSCRNLSQGVYPPVSGAFDNGFTAGMGSAIRTELWACLAPGDPELAAALAREDACVDHAVEGIYSAVYLATLESAAFVMDDREALLDLAAASLPADCRVARAIADTRLWWDETHDWMAVWERVLAVHGRQNFTDVAQNLAFIVLGWLAGEGSFDNALCIAVNCGKDADCTGATLGALLGILDPDSIGERWLAPIGRDLVLSPGIVGMHHVSSLDELSNQVTQLAVQVLDYYGSDVSIDDPDGSIQPDANQHPPRSAGLAAVALDPAAAPTESLVTTEPVAVFLSYPADTALRPGEPATLQLRLLNPGADELAGTLTLRAPDTWALSADVPPLQLAPGAEQLVEFSVTPPAADAFRVYANPLDLHFVVNGLTWVVSAGMVSTLPWRKWSLDSLADTCPQLPEDADSVEVAGHYQSLPNGTWAYATDIKLPYQATVRYVVQAPGAVRVWLDGEEINAHDGSWHVPAIHRAHVTGADVPTRRGWHRVTIAVDAPEAGELYLGVGSAQTWDWIRDAEWRLPQ